MECVQIASLATPHQLSSQCALQHVLPLKCGFIHVRFHSCVLEEEMDHSSLSSACLTSARALIISASVMPCADGLRFTKSGFKKAACDRLPHTLMSLCCHGWYQLPPPSLAQQNMHLSQCYGLLNVSNCSPADCPPMQGHTLHCCGLLSRHHHLKQVSSTDGGRPNPPSPSELPDSATSPLKLSPLIPFA